MALETVGRVRPVAVAATHGRRHILSTTALRERMTAYAFDLPLG